MTNPTARPRKARRELERAARKSADYARRLEKFSAECEARKSEWERQLEADDDARIAELQKETP